jgi:hypothetical protein
MESNNMNQMARTFHLRASLSAVSPACIIKPLMLWCIFGAIVGSTGTESKKVKGKRGRIAIDLK